MFFFRQKAAYEMRISDWSSDVCSSDLVAREVSFEHLVDAARVLQGLVAGRVAGHLHAVRLVLQTGRRRPVLRVVAGVGRLGLVLLARVVLLQLGRSSCRARVCTYV